MKKLQPEFRKKVEQLIINCSEKKIIIRPYTTRRSIWLQAQLWRQSRSIVKIEKEITRLKNSNANFLAYVIRNVGPHDGLLRTMAIPGLSWHQYGLAVDCYCERNGQAVFDREYIGYKIYREEGLKLGLFLGPEWDWCHLQAEEGSPEDHWDIEEINMMMSIKELMNILKICKPKIDC